MMKRNEKITIGDVNIIFFEHNGATRYEAVLDSDNKEVLECLGSDKNVPIIVDLANSKITIIINRYTDNTVKSITIYTDYNDYKRNVVVIAGVISGLQYNK